MTHKIYRGSDLKSDPTSSPFAQSKGVYVLSEYTNIDLQENPSGTSLLDFYTLNSQNFNPETIYQGILQC